MQMLLGKIKLIRILLLGKTQGILSLVYMGEKVPKQGVQRILFLACTLEIITFASLNLMARTNVNGIQHLYVIACNQPIDSLITESI